MSEQVLSAITLIFDRVVEYCILLVELVGVVILMGTVFRALVQLLRHKQKIRLELAEGIALALEFKMGGELLRTVIVREWNELLILGSIILLRAALAFLIQWEIRLERKNASEDAAAPPPDPANIEKN